MQRKIARRVRKRIFGIIAIILLAVILFNVVNIQNFILKKIYRLEYSEYVEKYAQMYNIDPLWIYAIIKVESNFNENAKSKSGAKGLMQLMDSTASELSKKVGIVDFQGDMLYNPELNIMLGTKYFDILLTKYNGNYNLAIAAYNSGIGTVDTWIEKGIIASDGSNIENIPYQETNMYVRKTIKSYSVYKKLYK